MLDIMFFKVKWLTYPHYSVHLLVQSEGFHLVICRVKLGLPFLHKFGPKIHLNEEKINRTKKLFEKFGPYFLFIGYFVPGVRHITAYLAGINSFSFKKFAIFAYSGAIFWSFSFITLGKVLGIEWNKVEIYMSKYSMYIIPLVVLVVIVGVMVYWRKRNINKKVYD